MLKLLKLMDKSGDTAVAFDTEDAAAVARARAEFDKAMLKAAAVVTVPRDGSPGQVVRRFEDLAEENVVIPAITGG